MQRILMLNLKLLYYDKVEKSIKKYKFEYPTVELIKTKQL
jgi:hypothetical protein